MNKKPILLIVSLLGGLSLSSCESIKPIETVKISVWSEPKEQEVIEKVIKQWNENHIRKHQIEIEFSSKHANYYNEEIIDELPSLFYATDSSIPNLIKNDLIYKIEEKKAKEIIENNVYVAQKGFEYKDCIYGYPTTIDNGYFLWYNKYFLNEKEASSLESILKIAKDNNASFYFDVANGWYVNSFFMSPQACGLQSINYLKDKDNKVYYNASWDDENGLEVAEYIQSVLSPYYYDNTLSIGSGMGPNDKFAHRKTIAVVSGIWSEKDFQTSLREDLAACKLPSFNINGKSYQMASFGSSKGYFVNNKKSEKEIQTANLLAQLLNSKDAQILRYQLTQSIPTRLDVIDNKKFKEISSAGAFALAQQSKYASVQYQTVENRYWSAGTKIGKALIENLDNNETLTEFLKQQMDELRTPKEEIIYD